MLGLLVSANYQRYLSTTHDWNYTFWWEFSESFCVYFQYLRGFTLVRYGTMIVILQFSMVLCHKRPDWSYVVAYLFYLSFTVTTRLRTRVSHFQTGGLGGFGGSHFPPKWGGNVGGILKFSKIGGFWGNSGKKS